jgi:hypothetical protein
MPGNQDSLLKSHLQKREAFFLFYSFYRDCLLSKTVEAGHILFEYSDFAHKRGFSKSRHRVG